MGERINNQKGFTLVEIMMVVIIIGILAVLAIPRYEKYTLESRLSEVAIAVGEIKTGMEKYYNSHGNTYAAVSGDYNNTSLQLMLRIDLGGQKNFMFNITTLEGKEGLNSIYYTGYKVIAYLTETGKKAEYGSSDIGDRVVYYFPKELNSLAKDDNAEPWAKGWNDDDFFVTNQASTPGL